MTYAVAKTQRKIAYNKYNLDLFDKRFEAYTEFRDEFHKIFDIGANLASLTKYRPKHRSLIKSLYKCGLLFPRYYRNGIDGDVYILQLAYQKKIDLVREELSKKFEYDCAREAQSNAVLSSEAVENIKIELGEIENKIMKFDSELLGLCHNALGYMEIYLEISHTPS